MEKTEAAEVKRLDHLSPRWPHSSLCQGSGSGWDSQAASSPAGRSCPGLSQNPLESSCSAVEGDRELVLSGLSVRRKGSHFARRTASSRRKSWRR